MKRFKWEPPALMALVLLLGVWLVWNQKNNLTGIKPAEGARTVEFRLGNSRGVVEVTSQSRQPVNATTSDARFRILLRNGYISESMSSTQFASTYGEVALNDVLRQGDNPVFRLLNITSWPNLAWVLLGFGGQLAFSGRMIIQWLVSEKERRSVIPVAFWWLSLAGGLATFIYFVWRQDFVAVLGQSSGLVIYARNIRLIYKQRAVASRATPLDASGEKSV